MAKTTKRKLTKNVPAKRKYAGGSLITPGGAQRREDTKQFVSDNLFTDQGKRAQQATGEALRDAAPVFGFAGDAPSALPNMRAAPQSDTSSFADGSAARVRAIAEERGPAQPQQALPGANSMSEMYARVNGDRGSFNNPRQVPSQDYTLGGGNAELSNNITKSGKAYSAAGNKWGIPDSGSAEGIAAGEAAHRANMDSYQRASEIYRDMSGRSSKSDRQAIATREATLANTRLQNAGNLALERMRGQRSIDERGMIGEQALALGEQRGAQALELGQQGNTNAMAQAGYKDTLPGAKAQTQLHTAQAEQALRTHPNAAAISSVLKDPAADPAMKMEAWDMLKQWNLRLEAMQARDARVKRADGGTVPAYAGGGAVQQQDGMPASMPMQGFAQSPVMPNPTMAKYGQYLAMAKQMSLPPLPLDKFMQTQQAAMMHANAAQQQNESQAVGTLLADGGSVPPHWKGTFTTGIRGNSDEFAGGGAIPVAGQRLEGVGEAAGGPKEDSIPAVIDGSRPAALSSGEFVIPAHIVKKLGTDFFDKLIGKDKTAKA